MDEEYKKIVAHELGTAGLAALTAARVHLERCWRAKLLFPCKKCEALHRESMLKFKEFVDGARRVILD